MKIILSLLFACIIGNFTFSQSAYSLVDAKILGSTSGEEFVTMLPDGEGNTYVVANTPSGTNGGDKNVSDYGFTDVWLLKLDSDKDIIWQKAYGGSSTDLGVGINLLPNGNIVLFSNTSSGISGNKTSPKKGVAMDVWVVELDSVDGSIIRQRTIGGDINTGYIDSKILDNGNIILLCGASDSGAGLFDIDEPPINSNNGDPWIAILDDQLNIIQQKRLIQGASNGGSAGGVGYGTLLIEDDYIYMAVSSSGNSGGYKSADSFDPTTSAPFTTDCWFLKLNWSFDVILENSFGGERDDDVMGMIRTGNGNLIIAMNSKSGIGGNKLSPRTGPYNNIWLIEVDTDGNKINDKTYGNSAKTYIKTKIHKLSKNCFVLGGYVEPVNDNDFATVSFYGGPYDAFLMAIDEHLNLKDISVFGTPGKDDIGSLYYKDGKITTGGNTEFSGTNQYHPINGIGSSDLWFLDFSTSLEVDNEELENISIYPNPANQTLHINDANNNLTGFSVFDPLGKQIVTQENIGNQVYQINVQDMAKGVYFLKLKFKVGNTASKKFVVK